MVFCLNPAKPILFPRNLTSLDLPGPIRITSHQLSTQAISAQNTFECPVASARGSRPPSKDSPSAAVPLGSAEPDMVNLVLHYKDHSEQATFAVTSLGKHDMILGFTWLCEHSPEIDWNKEEAHKEQRAKVFPPPLAFPHREALHKDVQGAECESPEEEEGGGEWTCTPDTEFPDETIEVGDWIYATTLCPPPTVAEI
ncbi:hypothetical protein E4T56_gene8314 [Termitomyces sp. T112]|nr:hypothetical protein E4T56_gene8314 [Termitomyces sp. T112]